METRVTVLETILPTLATKIDISEVRGEMKALHLATKADINEVRGEVKELRLSNQKDIAELRADITKWIVATVIAIVGTMAASFFGMFQVIKSSTSFPSAPAPIIIQVPPYVLPTASGSASSK